MTSSDGTIVPYEALACYWDGGLIHDILIFYDGELLSRGVNWGAPLNGGKQ